MQAGASGRPVARRHAVDAKAGVDRVVHRHDLSGRIPARWLQHRRLCQSLGPSGIRCVPGHRASTQPSVVVRAGLDQRCLEISAARSVTPTSAHDRVCGQHLAAQLSIEQQPTPHAHGCQYSGSQSSGARGRASSTSVSTFLQGGTSQSTPGLVLQAPTHARLPRPVNRRDHAATAACVGAVCHCWRWHSRRAQRACRSSLVLNTSAGRLVDVRSLRCRRRWSKWRATNAGLATVEVAHRTQGPAVAAGLQADGGSRHGMRAPVAALRNHVPWCGPGRPPPVAPTPVRRLQSAASVGANQVASGCRHCTAIGSATRVSALWRTVPAAWNCIGRCSSSRTRSTCWSAARRPCGIRRWSPARAVRVTTSAQPIGAPWSATWMKCDLRHRRLRC